MKYRVVKNSYSDGTEWFFIQKKNIFGKYKDYDDGSDYSSIWMGFDNAEKAIAKCNELNNPVVVVNRQAIGLIPDFKLILPPSEK
jgi:hypothetical protein